MPVNQVMTFTATVPTTGETPAVFNANAIGCWNELKLNVVPDLNVAFGEMNVLETNVNAKEVSAVAASAVAVAANNLKGTWSGQLTSISPYESWLYNDVIYMPLVAGTDSPVTTPSNWFALTIAQAIKNTPAGNISATTVQAAINELDTEKLSINNIHSATSKTTPADADELAIVDSGASNVLKKLTWANLKATIFASSALTGTPTAPTAALGTATTQLATTAFVKAHGNSGRTVNGVSGSVVLTTANLNAYFYADAGTNIFQLPDATVCPSGSTITVYGLSSGFTITSTSGNIYANQNVGAVSIVVYKGASVSLASNGSAWVQVASSRNIGEGQNWIDVSGSRAKDTIYTNTTGMPINVSISIGFNATSTQVYFQVNGVRMAEMLSDASKQHSITFIVPDGQTYAVSSVTGTSIITRWAELR